MTNCCAITGMVLIGATVLPLMPIIGYDATLFAILQSDLGAEKSWQWRQLGFGQSWQDVLNGVTPSSAASLQGTTIGLATTAGALGLIGIGFSIYGACANNVTAIAIGLTCVAIALPFVTAAIAAAQYEKLFLEQTLQATMENVDITSKILGAIAAVCILAYGASSQCK
ncbi:MAG: hypothetical protein JSS50_00800 [Proteobacteria bacterium]|nr:hypothetical protein [Pseudomonadota bacterium]